MPPSSNWSGASWGGEKTWPESNSRFSTSFTQREKKQNVQERKRETGKAESVCRPGTPICCVAPSLLLCVCLLQSPQQKRHWGTQKPTFDPFRAFKCLKFTLDGPGADMIQRPADVSQKHPTTSAPDVHTGGFRWSTQYQTKSNLHPMKTEYGLKSVFPCEHQYHFLNYEVFGKPALSCNNAL